MRVYIIAAMSADGFIAKSSSELIDWTSPEDKTFFREMTLKTGVIVLGGNTFRTFKAPLPGRTHIVYTRHKIDDPNDPIVKATTENPSRLVKRLSEEGCKELAVCGGQEIYSLFLKEGVVDEIYLTIEPLLFGKGLNLSNYELHNRLKIVEPIKKLNKDTLMIHYEVIK